ncbi:unnamed protein product [Protopolystoma xenopodis]|uniref:Uncharacterized protein n=1 Tax=Protopolystoma xenopodis TaxID=117903 RepID=A0A448XR37_9PLAT|nr:unnamed protein product [Protopolystoma xenopodis]
MGGRREFKSQPIRSIVSRSIFGRLPGLSTVSARGRIRRFMALLPTALFTRTAVYAVAHNEAQVGRDAQKRLSPCAPMDRSAVACKAKLSDKLTNHSSLRRLTRSQKQTRLSRCVSEATCICVCLCVCKAAFASIIHVPRLIQTHSRVGAVNRQTGRGDRIVFSFNCGWSGRNDSFARVPSRARALTAPKHTSRANGELTPNAIRYANAARAARTRRQGRLGGQTNEEARLSDL